ncbi:MAG: hypothetical protein A2W93_12040 [Bacteroidetes bacterium GWF2_43_63]|nr:MAG: hypothetical protein A2W94_11600 [Bacteroidetes bacterium GWE2_42_42]OFY56394.1 MAG: hypothetical protein A2W93_12040 [Bacteroidetes bacterium GWF2_43_63]
MSRFIFSGHESFQCRHFWLKKGYDFVNDKRSFNDEDAVVALGVGKNMVASIRFWMKAFNILTPDDKLTTFAHDLLSDNGWDPYLEDEASLWILHYHLIKSGFASTYSIVFNELRKEKIEFSKENYISFIKRKSESGKGFTINERTLHEDLTVLAKMYLRSDAQSKDKEDSFSGLLAELDLIRSYRKAAEDFFIIENNDKPEIPDEVILYAILDNDNFEKSLSLSSIEQGYNSVGSVFAISRAGILSKIENLTNKYPFLIFKDQAGIKEIQFKEKPAAESILKNYYAN